MPDVRADLPAAAEDWIGWVVQLTLVSGRTLTGEVSGMHADDQGLPTAVALAPDAAVDSHTVVPWHAIETARGKRSW